MEYGLFDANQHYYEAEDDFTRYASERIIPGFTAEAVSA